MSQPRPEPRPVIEIGESLPYEDGAEAELLALVCTAEDRRVGSDELAAGVHDWPTAYHLSPERAVLLAPLAIGPGDRVLDIGAGSGVNTRMCADKGAAVTAVEGSAARAELIAHRCTGLNNVEVLCGPLSGLGPDRVGVYDLALLVGVLEYAETHRGGKGGAATLLAQAVDTLAPDGVLVLAIENRLGLKYLLGFPEDHLGLPWAGCEGYREGEPTTWSRRELSRMLTQAGLDAQQWLYPFPDYKLPSAVLSEQLYHHPDAVELVDQIVGHPTSSEYAHPVLAADDRAAHRTMAAAGLGPDVANSFLVVAAPNPQAVAGRIDENILAWRVAPGRRRRWRQEAVVVRADEGMAMRRRLPAEEREGDFEDWLGQVVVPEEPYLVGRNLEQCLLDGARDGDVDKVAELLRDWRRALAAHEVSVDAVPEPHPYLPANTERALPPDWLDAGPDNFVVTAEGLVFVDREWQAAGGVDVRLAVVRGLWKAVSAMLSARCHLPWPVTWSNDHLVAHLGGLIGEDIDAGLLEQWRQAEHDLIGRVYRQPAVRLAELHDAGSRSRMDQMASPLAPYRRMEHEVHQLRALVAVLTASHEAVEADRVKIGDSDRARLERAEAESARLNHELGRVHEELNEARARLARVAWRERIHNMAARVLARLTGR
jgi:SAM-dependent methyltransferase